MIARYTLPLRWDVHISTTGLHMNETGYVTCTAELPKFVIPGTQVFYVLRLECGKRTWGGTTLLAPGFNKASLGITARQRGRYTGSPGYLELQDLLGFTSARIPLPGEELVRVYPDLTRSEGLATAPDQGGAKKPRTRHVKRSDELLETRKYVPGDDMRRLNWKVYAHSGELLLRIGEETPPPDSRLLCILDPAVDPSILQPQFVPAYVDSFAERAGRFVLEAVRNGVEVVFAVPGMPDAAVLNASDEEVLLRILSDFHEDDGSSALKVPRNGYMRAVIFSAPGSPRLPRLLSDLKESGCPVTLLLKDYPEPTVQTGGGMMHPSLSRLFLVPERRITAQEKKQTLSSAALNRFRLRLEQDVSVYGREPWRIRDVGTV